MFIILSTKWLKGFKMKKTNTQMIAQIMTSMCDFNEDECYLVQNYVNALKASRSHNAETIKTDKKNGSRLE